VKWAGGWRVHAALAKKRNFMEKKKGVTWEERRGGWAGGHEIDIIDDRTKVGWSAGGETWERQEKSGDCMGIVGV